MIYETKLYRFVEGKVEEVTTMEIGYQYFTATFINGMLVGLQKLPVR